MERRYVDGYDFTMPATAYKQIESNEALRKALFPENPDGEVEFITVQGNGRARVRFRTNTDPTHALSLQEILESTFKIRGLRLVPFYTWLEPDNSIPKTKK